MTEAKFREACNKCRDIYFSEKIHTSNSPIHAYCDNSMHRKCITLEFLMDFNKNIVAPINPSMTVQEVTDYIVKPATEHLKKSFIHFLNPGSFAHQRTAFISHAKGNTFQLLVDSLIIHFHDAVPSDVFLWIELFVINQHESEVDLTRGLLLKEIISVSSSVLVALDKKALPLSRLWCLYEIVSSPPDKVTMLTHGFSESDLGTVYSQIDANTADCESVDDKSMIRSLIHAVMVERGVVPVEADENTALTAFSGILKLLLILKPMSYRQDIATLLKSDPGHCRYPLDDLQTFLWSSDRSGYGVMRGRMACILGGPGEGKSTLAAAIVDRNWVDAFHCLKKEDVRRQDKALIIRSLAYQLAMRHAKFAKSILSLTSEEVNSLGIVSNAWKLLLEHPLKALSKKDINSILVGKDSTAAG